MIKTVLFVEGQTELIFTRELLLKYFEYSDIEIICLRLVTDSNTEKAEYDFQNENATYHFQIINVGNDKSVLSAILKREKYLVQNEYKKIIGLRDMYSKEYKEMSIKIEVDLIKKFIEETNKVINNLNSEIEIQFHFAIMEIEAWFLGIQNIFEKFDPTLTNNFIREKLGMNLDTIDPEQNIFHPTDEVDKILNLIGVKYSKSKSVVESIVGCIKKEHIITLLKSEKCKSFRGYWKDVIPSF